MLALLIAMLGGSTRVTRLCCVEGGALVPTVDNARMMLTALALTWVMSRRY